MSVEVKNLPVVTSTALGNYTISDDGTTTSIITFANLSKIIRPYQVYTVLMNQTGLAAPVPTIQENTIGAIVWTRKADGIFHGTLAGAFADATKLWMPNTVIATGATANIVEFTRIDADIIKMRTFIAGGANTNGLLTDTSIEIRYYY